MVTERFDKEKLLAYVLGELDRDETLSLARLIEQDPALRQEIQSLRKMTGRLEEAFTVNEDITLSPAQIAKIRGTAKTRATKRKWLVLITSIACGVIAVVTFIPKKEIGVPYETAPTIAANAPQVFEKHVVPPPETSWEISEGRTDVAMMDRAEPAAKVAMSPPSLPEKKSHPAKQISPPPIENPPSLAANRDVVAKREDAIAVAGLMKGKAAVSGGESQKATEASVRQEPAPSHSMRLYGKETDDHPHLAAKVTVDRDRTIIPAGFPPDVIEILEKNLNGVNSCFSARPFPNRVDMTVEVSAKGEILSINLIPSLPNTAEAIKCLKAKLSTASGSLKPISGHKEKFEAVLLLKP